MSVKNIDIKIDKINIFKNIIDAFKDLVSDGCFKFSNNNLIMEAIDSSSIALCTLKINNNFFKRYNCKDLSIGISLEYLSKILKFANIDNSLILTLTEEEPTILKIVLEGLKKSKFDFKISNISFDSLNIPDDETIMNQYNAIISLNFKEFKSILLEYKAITTDYINLTITKENEQCYLSFISNGTGAIGLANTTIEVDEIKEIENNSTISNIFSIKYLIDFTKLSLAEDVFIYISIEHPLIIEYKIDDCNIKYFLAPKISE